MTEDFFFGASEAKDGSGPEAVELGDLEVEAVTAGSYRHAGRAPRPGPDSRGPRTTAWRYRPRGRHQAVMGTGGQQVINFRSAQEREFKEP